MLCIRSIRFLVLCVEPGAAGATPMQATEAMGFECNNECVLDSLMDWHHEMTICKKVNLYVGTKVFYDFDLGQLHLLGSPEAVSPHINEV